MLSETQELLVDRYKNPQYAGSLNEPKQQADGANQVCGDDVHMEIQQQDGKILAIRHHCRACAVCSASADFLAEHLEGETVSRITQIGPEEVQGLLGIPLSPIRLKCALLPLETLRQALEEA